MEKWVYLCFLIFMFRSVCSQSLEIHNVTECTTPKKLTGTCINLKDCKLLRNLLETQRTNETIANFLRKSRCGYEGKFPKVCCPIDIAKSDNSTKTTRSVDSSEYDIISYSKFPSQKTCGRTNSTRIRIVGGNRAELGDWPWMTAIGYRDINNQNKDLQWLCGGALISDKYVITAAHCKDIPNRKMVSVRLGELDLNPNVTDGATPIDILIKRIILHERYNPQDHSNDIALLKLEKSVTFNAHIQPICLPILPDMRSNKLVKMQPFVAGWGLTSFRGSETTSLMDVQLPVVDNADCKRAFSNKRTSIDDRVICAGLKTGGKDACQGDSGGPLMWPNGNQYYLVGVVSYGFKCAEPNFPGVYSRVSSFIEWITQNTNDN